jgi:hypothetical protein
LSEFSAEEYFGAKFMDESTNGKRSRMWIRDGAVLEDAGTALQFINGTARSLNHFHSPTTTNPTKATIETSGLSDLASGKSALMWAQDGPYQISKGWEDWSWLKVREHQYNYLTATTEAAENDSLAKLLKGLGYQMHLIQDMGHPSHVRNNTHIVDGKGLGGFETWTKNNNNNIVLAGILNKKDSNGNPVFPIPVVAVDLTIPFDTSHNLSPVARLFDTRTYLGTSTPTAQLNQGLSEYTNSNFFSQDTIFAAERFSDNHENKYYLPYPRKVGTNVQQYLDRTLSPTTETDETGKQKTSIWIRKTGEGEQIGHLAREGNFTRFWQSVRGEGNRFYGSFELDEISYKDYAEKLIPRAVGYSKALLDYFFRGDGAIELTLPASGVYAKALPDGAFNEIRLNAKSKITTGEDMPDGDIKLVVRYLRPLQDPFQTQPVDYAPEYSFIVVPEKNSVRKIPKPTETATEMVFDLSGIPVPLSLWASDVEMWVVYKGQLGLEKDAVAMGLKDIAEVTPVDVYNNTDYTCLNNKWYRYDDPAALAIVDSHSNGIADRSDIYPHTISNVIFQSGPANAATITASTSFNNLSATGPLQPGQMLRLGYILTDYANRYAFDEQWTNLSANDIWAATSSTTTFSGTGFTNQSDKGYSAMYTMRGSKVWWGSSVIYDNDAYPAGSSCDWNALQ